jgi:hypothetical protein
VTVEHLVALVPFVHGHVRLLAGQVFPADDGAAGEGDDRAVGLAVAGVPADGHRLAVRPRPRRPARAAGPHAPGAPRVPAGEHRLQRILGRLGKLDRGETPVVADPPVTAQHGNDLAELGGCQRVKRMRRAHAVTPS